MHPNLAQYGWNSQLQTVFEQATHDSLQPARVIAEYGMNYRVAAPDEFTAEIPGKVLYELVASERPKVGDWVLLERIDSDRGIIHQVLPRTSEIARLQTDRTRSTRHQEKQVLAVNVDTAFLVQSLDQDFSPQRLERYLFALGKSGIDATIVLNKIDLGGDVTNALLQLTSLHLPVITTSAKTGEGMSEIVETITPGATAVFMGSSGVGKSTITNWLLGEDRQVTQAVRESDSKGRHTTSHRELFKLPGGGLVIDTPGLRELQLWGSESALETVFSDIENIALGCQFQDCIHMHEPSCAVRAAVADGALAKIRLENFHQFQRELRASAHNYEK